MLTYCVAHADGVGLRLVADDSLKLILVEDEIVVKATEEFNIAFDLMLDTENREDEGGCTTAVCAQNNESLTVFYRERDSPHSEHTCHLPFASLQLQSFDIFNIFAIDITLV